ncbi:MAG: hypothetical protein V4646_05520 [Pseudomonadota bacterium]
MSVNIVPRRIAKVAAGLTGKPTPDTMSAQPSGVADHKPAGWIFDNTNDKEGR